ncbi:MAG TPA: YihY/virulence factor BrkB family protein [Geminicoccus sp.]|jgi:membrane protein|uniref:YihY/virulence factor BrkB family protein n=1 Tax=Geminicoccus sp. TaxID=2024832 RepID=UPI002E361490|nr:YihY/virulence factor BrkB family protein [Geminicoccus sp.]HEX2528905.1 YihY/virulence factor BrkB family protein [Geminicoccus sp.]
MAAKTYDDSQAGKDRAPGREAASPQQIPARGWWQITKRVVSQTSEDRLLTEAAAVTFFGLLSIFPGLAALVSLYGLVANPDTVTQHLSALEGIIPGGGMDLLTQQVQGLASTQSGALSFGAALGILTALWSSNQGTKAMFDALNIVYEEKEKRSFIWLTLCTLAFTLCAMVFVIVALFAVVGLPIILNFVGLGQVGDLLIRLARWPILLVMIVALLAVLYRYGPSREKAEWRWVTPGSTLAAIVWLVGSILFSWYVSRFGNYDATYGSLGAVIGFMTWIWISAIVVLVGAELNAEMEHQVEHDSTTGPDRSMGQRGAKMADEVARS